MKDVAYLSAQINGAKRRLENALEFIAVGDSEEANLELEAVCKKVNFLSGYLSGVVQMRLPIEGASTC